MKSRLSFFDQTRHSPLQNYKKSETILNQIDFNKVLHIINEEKHQSFSSFPKQKNFFMTEKSQLNPSTHHKSFSHNNLSNLNQILTSYQHPNHYLSHQNKNFQDRQLFRVTFPIRRDFSKKKIKTKAQLNTQNKKTISFVSSLEQLESAFPSGTVTPKQKSGIQLNNLRNSQPTESKTLLNFYTIEQIRGKSSNYNKKLIRQIGKYVNQEQKIPIINTVEEYLRMSKKQHLLKKTNPTYKNVSADRKKRLSGKRCKLLCTSRGQNHS